MSCSINFNRRGKPVEVVYIPDEEFGKICYEDDEIEVLKNALNEMKHAEIIKVKKDDCPNHVLMKEI